jgi:hypothetical protein
VAGLGDDTEVVSVTGLREFAVAGALSAAYTGGGTVVSADYDAANDAWHDNNPKRDYVTREWMQDVYDTDPDEGEPNVTWTLTETQRCQFPQPCSPNIVYISHGKEFSEDPIITFPDGNNPFSLQIGDPNPIAELTGITTGHGREVDEIDGKFLKNKYQPHPLYPVSGFFTEKESYECHREWLLSKMKEWAPKANSRVFFTTNIKVEDFSLIFSAPLIDRIFSEMKIVFFTGQSKREYIN